MKPKVKEKEVEITISKGKYKTVKCQFEIKSKVNSQQSKVTVLYIQRLIAVIYKIT